MPSGGAIQTHAYAAAGAYTVQARDQGGSAAPVIVSVTVSNPRQLVFNPAQPNVGETVVFQAQNFLTPNSIAWNFGDGATIAVRRGVADPRLRRRGTYAVQARDQGGRADPRPSTVSVPVVNKRQIQFSPAAVQTGKAVQFQALNFTTTCIRWNFGDGTILDQGTPVQSHTYAKPGAFQVQATDNCGNSTWSASTAVLVAPSEGPLAAFSVSYGILRFEDGKTNIIVSKNTLDLAAFADLKYEGTGSLLVEWRVDGLPFKSDSKVLTFGQQTTLTTGKTPGLPTLVPGTHTVELIIRRPGGAFTLPPIVYTVSSAVQDKSPLVQTVTPSEISPGKEQELILEGRNLTAGTAVTFGLGVGIVQPLEALSAGRAKIKVFVAPTAKLGDRLAKAANLQGTNTGPGSIHIVTAPVVFEPKPLACTDINTIPHFEIILKAPFFYKIPTPEYKQEGGMIVPVGPKGDVTINVPTVDDFSVLRWTLPSYQYEYLEVRFFRPSSATPLVIRRIDGTSTSLPLSGDLLAELFAATKPSGHPIAQTNKSYVGGYPVLNKDVLGPGAESSGIPSDEELYAKGVAAGADIAWQVAAFTVYPCVFDSKKPGPNEFQQPVEEAASDKWLFNLPNAFTGMDCAATAKKAKVTIQALNLTAAKRDEAKQTPGVTGIANFIGDRIQLQGSFTLQGSPYGTHVWGGNSLKVQNLFIDWGDGSACSPVLVKVQGGGSFTKDSVLVLQSAIWGTHDYESEGNFSIRLFQLAEDDIQLPLGDFFAALGSAVSPQPAGKNTYKTVLDAGQGPSAQAKAAESEPDPLAAALPRAYLIFCHNIKISHYRDSCAAGPIQLTSLEILNFPGHDVIMPGKSQQGAEGGVNINPNMAALYNGIHAVAVTCDKALIARARLRYFGKGSVEVTWYVDGQAVQAETFALASNDRGNLSPDQAADCSQPLVADLVFTSQPFSVAVLGKHTVRIRARIVPSYKAVNTTKVVEKAVSNLLAKKANPASMEAGSGPAAWTNAAGEPPADTYDPLLAQLAAEEKKGLAVPQIGILSPAGETNGKPAVVYVNDALKNYDAPLDAGGAWLAENAMESSDFKISGEKAYQVNEVRDVKFCQIIFPTTGGDFIISDLGSSLQMKGTVYDGVGTLIYKVRTSGGAVLEKYAAGSAFQGWDIEEKSGRVRQGNLDTTPPSPETLFLPAQVHGTLRRLQGQVNGQALQPLAARFDLVLQSAQGAFLVQTGANAGKPPEWKNAAGALDSEGNWLASNLALNTVGLGRTGFSLSASAVTVDFSTLAAPGGAEGPAASAGWTGIYLGGAVVDPYTFDLSGSKPVSMTNLEPWMIGDKGLSGKARSGSLSAKLVEATVGVNHLDFEVAANTPKATFYQCAIHVPWIGAVLKGNAVMQLISQAEGYGINWAGLTADPVTVTYNDKGRISLAVSGLVWGRDSRGWRARGQVDVTAETEGKTFASFGLNGVNFGADGRAYFDGPSWSRNLGLSGSSAFGEATAALQSVIIEASSSGADRLAFHIAAQVSLSPDSNFIPASDVLFHYLISRPGADYILTGPWNSEFSTKVVFPLGSQEIDSTISPSYEGAGADPAAFAGGDGAASGPAELPARRLGGRVGHALQRRDRHGHHGRAPRQGRLRPRLPERQELLPPVREIRFHLHPAQPGPAGHPGDRRRLRLQFRPGGLPEFREPAGRPTRPGRQRGLRRRADRGDLGQIHDHGRRLFHPQHGRLGGDGLHQRQDHAAGEFLGLHQLLQQERDRQGLGPLDLLGGLVNFSLGADEANAAIDILFGQAGWHVYAGRYEGPRITAKVWLLNCSSYLQLDNKGLKMGGSNTFELRQGAVIVSGYIKSWMDIGLGINPDPFYIEGSWEQGVAAGGCIDIEIKELCLDFSVTASVYARAPDPTVMRASASLDFGVDTVTMTVEL